MSEANSMDCRVGQPEPERRVCLDCGHSGTDGGSTTESYCGACGSTVPYPDKDLCQECGHDNCMLIACPCCGGEYHLESDLLDDDTANTTAETRQTAQKDTP
jgi:hypothetical protein